MQCFFQLSNILPAAVDKKVKGKKDDGDDGDGDVDVDVDGDDDENLLAAVQVVEDAHHLFHLVQGDRACRQWMIFKSQKMIFKSQWMISKVNSSIKI